MARASSAPKIKNRPRQPVIGSSHCTGKVEATMPKAPVINIHELARICAPGAYQRR